MEHLLEAEQRLPYSVEQVFGFFAEADNLERITPRELRFAIVTPRPIVLAASATIDYRLRLFGIPFGWRSVITEWDPPRAFTDEQVEGPYALWIHRHTFEPERGGTMIRDRVRYRLPLGPLGDLAHPLVRRQLARIFDYRRRAVEAAFPGGTP
ncbi:MAG TPA: SRPBCC family protein [Candidatus Polarisedimenticolaceae bacterium]|nr:SRPBCC family protein [Candidatus Polarisedimenticolaceae bacterium]